MVIIIHMSRMVILEKDFITWKQRSNRWLVVTDQMTQIPGLILLPGAMSENFLF